jgi:hypothetical protein
MMHSLRQEEAMRKSVKVAMVFTGTTAYAAAFVPAAGAATAAGAQQMVPATSHHNCALGPRTTSVVLWWPGTAHHGPTCVGGQNFQHQGTPLGTYFSYYCPGNNIGTLSWNGGDSNIIFSLGQTKQPLHHRYLSQAYISSWSGHDTCST